MAAQHSDQGWQLATESAEAYERYLVPAIFAGCALDLVELGAPQPGEAVVDVACGSGIVARTAATRVGPSGTVAGVDLNPGMLAVARAASATVQPRIDWHEADARSLPFADMTFDVAFCQFGLMFFGDPGAALAEIHRVLAPGGRLALSVWRGLDHIPAYDALVNTMERNLGEEAGRPLRSVFGLGEQHVLRDLLGRAGFADVRIQIDVRAARYPSPAELWRREAAASPMAAEAAAIPDEIVDRMVADLAEALRDHTDDGGVVLPIEAHVVLARR